MNEEIELIASDTEAGDRFGISVDVFNDVVVVGAYYEDANNIDRAGAAYIYRKIGNTWQETKNYSALTH